MIQMHTSFRRRLFAVLVHLAISCAIAALAALLVFGVWFPSPYDEAVGGKGLFWLMVSVDVVLGPALTAVVFNIAKRRRELLMDLGLIGLLQLMALCFGLYTMYIVRPVYLVHEVDRFQVVSVADLDLDELSKAKPEFQKLPAWGVKLIGVRKPETEEEKLYSLDQALAGKDVSKRPDYWQELSDENRKTMRERGRDLSRFDIQGEALQKLDRLLKTHGLTADQVMLFPMMAKGTSWSVLLTRDDQKLLGYLPVDGFEYARPPARPSERSSLEPEPNKPAVTNERSQVQVDTVVPASPPGSEAVTK